MGKYQIRNPTKETESPDFRIRSNEPVSSGFLERGIHTFSEAGKFVQELPYGRNPDKSKLVSVFTDNCGTCSTKHALLFQLARENQFNDLRLFCGLFKMNSQNTPAVATILHKYGLEYIPEAHNYLKYKNQILDFTFPGSEQLVFAASLIKEIEILPHQITGFKINYHKNYIGHWLKENKQIELTLSEIWVIREQCISHLSTVPKHKN